MIPTPMPSHMERYNGVQPCDMLIGPCSCGAWHNKQEKARVKITKAEFDILQHADDWCRKMEWAVTSCRMYRKANILSCVKKGWMRQVAGLVVMVDGDGFTGGTDRYRVGYELTDAGRAALESENKRRYG